MDNMKTVNVTINVNQLKEYKSSYFLFCEVNKKGELINEKVFEAHIRKDYISEETAIELIETYKDIKLFAGQKECRLAECIYCTDYKTKYLMGGYEQSIKSNFNINTSPKNADIEQSAWGKSPIEKVMQTIKLHI